MHLSFSMYQFFRVENVIGAMMYGGTYSMFSLVDKCAKIIYGHPDLVQSKEYDAFFEEPRQE